MISVFRRAALVIGLAALAAGAWQFSATRASGEATATSVEVTAAANEWAPFDVTVYAGEQDVVFYFDPNPLVVPSSQLRVTFVNNGPGRQHTFNVMTQDGRDQLFNSDIVAPGAAAVFDISLPGPGSYTFYCILYGHGNKGQTGELAVTP